MLKDARIIADLYLENTMTTQIGQSQSPDTASPARADGAAAGLTPALKAAAGTGSGVEAAEEKKEEKKQLPKKNWVTIESVIEQKDILYYATQIARLIHTCSADNRIANLVVNKVKREISNYKD
jgi:hypothetical protein